MAFWNSHREGQTEFKVETIRNHQKAFGALFCRLCGASMVEATSSTPKSVEHPIEHKYYAPVTLNAHHTEPFKDVGHNTTGILTCSPCHSELHTGKKGNLSIFGALVASIIKENPNADLKELKKK